MAGEKDTTTLRDDKLQESTTRLSLIGAGLVREEEEEGLHRSHNELAESMFQAKK